MTKTTIKNTILEQLEKQYLGFNKLLSRKDFNKINNEKIKTISMLNIKNVEWATIFVHTNIKDTQIKCDINITLHKNIYTSASFIFNILYQLSIPPTPAAEE